MSKYKFSAPMPYSKKDIDNLLNINYKVNKSEINSLFFSLPSNCDLFTGFEQYRNRIFNSNWDFWKALISHTLEKGIDFIYLINNPARLSIEQSDFEIKLDKLDKLLNELQKIGVNKLRVSNNRLISYINKYYPQFILYASTSFEYKIISEYKNFMFLHPYVKQIVPSHDLIKNYALLKNLRKLLKDTEIELIVNEGCLNGCPVREAHAGELLDNPIKCKDCDILSNYFHVSYFCSVIQERNHIKSLLKSNIIYPWEIKEYAKIGINNFKFVGRDAYFDSINIAINGYLNYLKGIDNVKNIENKPISTFSHHYRTDNILKQLTVKDYKKYLPNINYFKKYGHLCASRCGMECRYCYKCAEKIQKELEKQVKKSENKPHYVPACTMKNF